MDFPRLNPNREKRATCLLLRPIHAVVLVAGLAAGIVLELLTPQPYQTALAQVSTPSPTPEPVCGNDICEPPYEQYYNCADCLTSCPWCTDGAFCDSIMPDDYWYFVPRTNLCSTEGCCIYMGPPDSTPPVTTATLDGTEGLAGWFLSPVTVSLTATDNSGGSGVYSTNLDGTPYTGPRLYDAEGATTIAYQSYDAARNLEGLKTTTFYIDTVAPVSTIILPAVPGEWYHGEVMLAGTAFDATSGVAEIGISPDRGATWLPATGGDVWAYPWDTRTVPDGMVGVLVRGSDQAGNVETPLSIAIGVDNSNPFFNVGPFPGEHCFSCSGPITFTLTAIDEQSRIDNTAIVVKRNGKDVRVLKAPGGELRGVPIAWDGRDDQGQPVPAGDYQMLFYTANHAGLFGSFGASIRVVDALPAAPPAAAPIAPAEPPEHTPWIMTPIPPTPGQTSEVLRVLAQTSEVSTSSMPQTSVDKVLSLLEGAAGGASSGKTGAAGAGAAAILVAAAAYIAARQSMGDKVLGQKLAELAGQYRPKEKPTAPPPPQVVPPLAPPPPPPRPRPLRWDEISHLVPAPPSPPKPVYYPPPVRPIRPRPGETPVPYRPPRPGRSPRPSPATAPTIRMRPRETPVPLPMTSPSMRPVSPYRGGAAGALGGNTPKPPVDPRALARERERLERQKSLEKSNLNWFQKATVNVLSEGMLALDAFDQYIAPKVTETAQAAADTVKKIDDYRQERERKRLEQYQELDKTNLSTWQKVLVVTLTDAQTNLDDFDKGVGQVVRPGLTKAVDHAGEDINKVLGWEPLAPGETREDVALRVVTVNNLDMLTLGLFRTEAGKQMAVSLLTGAKEAVDLTSHNSRMVVGLEELDPGVNRWEAAGEALYGVSTIMSLGGTADIREGIEEGDPFKVVMGTFQTVTMFAGIGALGSTMKTAGLKAVGAIDDIAYKEALTAIKTLSTAGETADALSGVVQAGEGLLTGNPIDVISGLANVGMADIPSGATKEAIEELTEEGVERVTKEAVEEVTEEGIEKGTREAAEELTEEGVEKVTKEAVEEATEEGVEKGAREAAEELTEEGVEKVTREAVGDATEEGIERVTKEAVEEVTEETTEVVGKQVDEVVPRRDLTTEPDIRPDLINDGYADQPRLVLGNRWIADRNVKEQYDEAVKVIESIHRIDDIPEQKIYFESPVIEKDTGIQVNSTYRYTDNNKYPSVIIVDPNRPGVGFSIVHETGHPIDNYGFGALDPETQNHMWGTDAYETEYFRATHGEEVQNAFRNLFKELENSETVKDLRKFFKNATSDDREYTKYLLTRREQFARSYSQYIAAKSTSELLQKEVKIQRALTLKNKMPEVWDKDEFKPIEKAFDRLFEAKGWKK